jgi:hypothetical protein
MNSAVGAGCLLVGLTCTARVGLSVVTRAGGELTGGKGLARSAHVIGVQSTRSVVAQSAPFDGVTVALGSARTGCGGVTGLLGGEGARGTMGVGVRARGVVSSFGGMTSGSGSARSVDAVT